MFVDASLVPDPANDPSKEVSRFKNLFIFLQVFGGQVGLPLFVATMLLARSVKRHLTLVNFLVSWIIYSIVYCLTFYHEGDRTTGISGRLCIAQAAMVHGVVPLAVMAYCALHVQVWLGVRAAFNENSWIQRQRRRLLVALFFAPYIVFIGFSVWSLVIVLQHPELIERNGAYYCTINYNPLIYAVPGFAAGIIVIMLLLEILIGVALIRRWKALHRTPRLSASALSMIARIAVFSVYGFATLGACAAFLARSLNIWPFLVQASLPTAIFLVFGNRLDVWRTWLFWRRHGEEDRDAHSVAICVTLDTTIEGEGERGVERASDLENEREHAEVQKEKLPELDEVRSEV